MTTKEVKQFIADGALDHRLADIYLDNAQLSAQKDRYTKAIEAFEVLFGAGEISIFSAPGRTEIGGNHTDHQHGEVLAASINLDTIAVAEPIEAPVVKVVSGTHPMLVIPLDTLESKEKEKGTTLALIKGILAGIKKLGKKIGGFQAYITSDVLIGAGLSSSAAFETVIGTILSGLYNEMSISPVEIALIGQQAEREYFGKPCGLMDQTASSVGNLVHIDFADEANPIIESISFDFEKSGYRLCITNTLGSHADLTADYASIPTEMKAVAALFHKEVLQGITLEELLSKAVQIRETVGDRALLRAIHFVNENKRVQQEVAALRAGDIASFLSAVKASGCSSFQYLQNVYSNLDVQHQNLSVALAISESVLGNNGVVRVHGGGFAGTIQAFVKEEAVCAYKETMEAVFGGGTCEVLHIRRYGGIKVI